MNSINTINSILHRSSRRKDRTNLPIASSEMASDNYAPTKSSRTTLIQHYFVGHTFVSNIVVRVRNKSSVYSIRKLSNFRFLDTGITQDATKNCGSMNLSDSSTGERTRYS